jgi:hypothetical protein
VRLEDITSRFALALRVRLNPRAVQADCTVGQNRKMINMALGHMSDDYLSGTNGLSRDAAILSICFRGQSFQRRSLGANPLR